MCVSRQECGRVFLRAYRDWHVGGDDGRGVSGESAGRNEVRTRTDHSPPQRFSGENRRLYCLQRLHCLRLRHWQSHGESRLSSCAFGTHHRSCGESEVVHPHVAEPVALGADNALFAAQRTLRKRIDFLDSLWRNGIHCASWLGARGTRSVFAGCGGAQPAGRSMARGWGCGWGPAGTESAMALPRARSARLFGMVRQLSEFALRLARQPLRIEGNKNRTPADFAGQSTGQTRFSDIVNFLFSSGDLSASFHAEVSLRVLVTGAAGFIGSNMVDRLLAASHTVVGFDNMSTGQRRFLEPANANPQFAFHQGDLLEGGSLKQAMEGCELVVHFAANADVRFGTEHPRKDLEQNTIATWNVLEAMREHNCKRIVFSST